MCTVLLVYFVYPSVILLLSLKLCCNIRAVLSGALQCSKPSSICISMYGSPSVIRTQESDLWASEGKLVWVTHNTSHKTKV
jgi:hypothetical protein